MILKILSLLFISNISFGAAFQYGGIKHDITSQPSTISTIILTSGSTQVQRVTGSTAQDLKLPDATTLRAGYWYDIVNESSAALTIRDTSSVLIGTLAAASQAAPTHAQLYLTSNGTDGGPWTYQASSAGSGSGGSGESVTKDFAVTSHGFAVGDIVYLNGSTWTKAIATSAAASEAIAMVSAVADANNFSATFSGYVSGLSGLTKGDVMFLSASSAGSMSSTEPSTAGQISKPVGVALSTTELRLYDSSRGAIISSGGSGGGTSPLTVTFGGTVSAADCTSNPCTIWKQNDGSGGNWVSSVGRAGTGLYAINISPTLGSAPNCSAIAMDWSGNVAAWCGMFNDLPTTTEIDLDCRNTGGSAKDVVVQVTCFLPQ
jgi:hypothetical protein